MLGIEGGFSPYRWMTSSSDGSPLQCAAHRSRTAADPAGSSRPSRGTRTYPATHPALASAHTNVVSGGNDAIDTTSSSAPAHAAGPQHGHQHRSSPPHQQCPHERMHQSKKEPTPPLVVSPAGGCSPSRLRLPADGAPMKSAPTRASWGTAGRGERMSLGELGRGREGLRD